MTRMDKITASQSASSGVAMWRARQAEEKARRMAELAELRENAATVERDGRTFKLVKIPDAYDFDHRPEPTAIKPRFHRHQVALSTDGQDRPPRAR
jgi:hypothetical protein